MIAVALLFSGMSEAQSFSQRGGQMRGEQGEQQGMRGGDQGREQSRGGEMIENLFSEAGVEMPDDWAEMTKEEQMEYMEDNGIEMPERPEGMEGGEREENTSSTVEGEQSRGIQQGAGEEMLEELFEEAGVEMPDDWIEMTREEQREYMEDSGIEMAEKEERERQIKDSKQMLRNRCEI